MKRIGYGLLLVAMVAVLVPGLASASVATTAAGFAADCNADGNVHVTGTYRVLGGVGTLTKDCFVALDKDSYLAFYGATVKGACCFIISSGLRGSRFVVYRSTFDVNVVQFAAGCCGGEPGHLEANARTIIRESSITAVGSLEISASTADDRGIARVIGSTLVSKTDVVVVYASISGSYGTAEVTGSVLKAAKTIGIATGLNGSTTATGNTFVAPGGTKVATDTGGTCTSTGNTPPAPCLFSGP